MGAEKYRVLFVDDDPLALVLLRRIFETEKDIDLVATSSPHEALDLALVGPLDMVVADQRMPEMLGLQLLARVRELAPDALRVLLTAYPDLEIAMAGINKGLLHRLGLKPWDPDDMIRTLRADLDVRKNANRDRLLAVHLRGWFERVLQSERTAVASSVRASCHGALDPLRRLCESIEEERQRLVDTAERSKDVNEVVLAAGRIAGNARNLGALATTLFSRDAVAPESQRTQQPWNVDDVLAMAVQVCYARSPGVEPRLELGAVPPLRCSGEDVAAVVIHLLWNALDATPPARHCEVTLKTWQDKRDAFIEITSPLGPLPAGVSKHPFAPAKHPRANHLGLGLASAAERAHRLGAQLELTRNDPDGVAFRLTLPLRASQRPSD